MTEELLEMPDIKVIREILDSAKSDIQAEVKNNPDFASETALLMQVIKVIEEKVGSRNDLAALGIKDKIDIAAHLTFLQCLFDDMVIGEDEEFDEDEDDDFEDEDLEDEE